MVVRRRNSAEVERVILYSGCGGLRQLSADGGGTTDGEWSRELAATKNAESKCVKEVVQFEDGDRVEYELPVSPVTRL